MARVWTSGPEFHVVNCGTRDAFQKTMEKKHATFGIYRSRDQVQTAVETLTAQGFDPSKINVMYPEHFGAQDFAYDLRTMVRMGAVIGALIGSVAGALIGAFVFTGLNYTLLGLLFGLFFGAAAGALVGIGTPERPGRRYLQYLKDGGFLLSVHVDTAEQSQRALELLEKTGGEDLVETDEVKAWMTVLENAKNKRPASWVDPEPSPRLR